MSGEADRITSAGIDVGSATIKVAVIADSGEQQTLLEGDSERIRRRDSAPVARALFDKVLEASGLAEAELDYIATTGEGEMITYRTGHFYSMTAHARGGLFLDPKARSIIDIGALHTRAVLMDDRAKVLSYRMTSQCASGSGQFLENIGRYLGVTIEEIGPLSLQADAPEPCSSICAVLAETDVINMVSRNVPVCNILKGIHQSMAGRYFKLLNSTGATGRVMLTGGLAMDVGLKLALEEAAEEQGNSLDIRSHPNSILAGALGAALWGAFRARKLGRAGLSLNAGGG